MECSLRWARSSTSMTSEALKMASASSASTSTRPRGVSQEPLPIIAMGLPSPVWLGPMTTTDEGLASMARW